MRIFLIMLLIILGGCSNARLGDFSVMSTRNVDLGAEYVLLEKNVMGEDKAHIIIFIPTGTVNLENCIDNALKSVGGDLMTDAVLKYEAWWIPYIYGQTRYYVEGDVWKKVSKTSSEINQLLKDPETIIFTAIEEDGEVKLSSSK